MEDVFQDVQKDTIQIIQINHVKNVMLTVRYVLVQEIVNFVQIVQFQSLINVTMNVDQIACLVKIMIVNYVLMELFGLVYSALAFVPLDQYLLMEFASAILDIFMKINVFRFAQLEQFQKMENV